MRGSKAKKIRRLQREGKLPRPASPPPSNAFVYETVCRGCGHKMYGFKGTSAPFCERCKKRNTMREIMRDLAAEREEAVADG